MAQLLNSVNRLGYRFTSPNQFVDYSRKYTIRKFQYRKEMTFIGFYDNVSNSLCFGFRVRRFKSGMRYVYCQFPNGYKSKQPIPPEFYKEVISTLKSQVKHIC